jgi:hypothetical protein
MERPVAMSEHDRHNRKMTIVAFQRALRSYWEDELARPVPVRLMELLPPTSEKNWVDGEIGHRIIP